MPVPQVFGGKSGKNGTAKGKSRRVNWVLSQMNAAA
jgi:hypothetical protein